MISRLSSHEVSFGSIEVHNHAETNPMGWWVGFPIMGLTTTRGKHELLPTDLPTPPDHTCSYVYCT